MLYIVNAHHISIYVSGTWVLGPKGSTALPGGAPGRSWLPARSCSLGTCFQSLKTRAVLQPRSLLPEPQARLRQRSCSASVHASRASQPRNLLLEPRNLILQPPERAPGCSWRFWDAPGRSCTLLGRCPASKASKPAPAVIENAEELQRNTTM